MNYSKESLDITCSANEYLPVSELVDFQGTLKTRTERDIQNILSSFERHGFAFPFFVWNKDDKNYVLDGHGRLQAVNVLKSMGVSVPDLPIVRVKCKDEKSAKRLVLQLNSHYGRMTKESVVKFIDGDITIDLNSFELPADTMIFTKLDEEAFQIPSNPSFVANDNPIFTPTFSEQPEELSETSKINNSDLPLATIGEYYLSYGEISCLVAQNEYEQFKAFVDKYYEKNGTYEGVINELFNSLN